jgi:hypothetical protein
MKKFFSLMFGLQAAFCSALLDASSENDCLGLGGKWVRFWLIDSGDNGMTLELTATDGTDSTVIASSEISSTETDSTVTSARCMDYNGEDNAPCYSIVTSTDGSNHDELSWIVKISGIVERSGETVEALRSGNVFDQEYIQCGKQYKKLGRYVNNQLEKSIAEDAANNIEVRTYTKMESKAIDLGIQNDPS